MSNPVTRITIIERNARIARKTADAYKGQDGCLSVELEPMIWTKSKRIVRITWAGHCLDAFRQQGLDGYEGYL